MKTESGSEDLVELIRQMRDEMRAMNARISALEGKKEDDVKKEQLIEIRTNAMIRCVPEMTDGDQEIDDFGMFVEKLETGARNNGCTELVDGDDKYWENLDAQERKTQSRIMIGVLEAKIKKEGSTVHNKYRGQKDEDPDDGRKLYFAVANAFSQQTISEEVKKIKREIGKLKYDGDFKQFMGKLNALFRRLTKLKDTDSKKSYGWSEEKKCDVLKEKLLESEQHMAIGDRTWFPMFNKVEDRVVDVKTKKDVSLKALEQSVEKVAEQVKDADKTGRVHSQQRAEREGRDERGPRRKGRYDKSETKCYNCGGKGHTANDCRKPKTPNGVCIYYFHYGHCDRGRNCHYRHVNNDDDQRRHGPKKSKGDKKKKKQSYGGSSDDEYDRSSRRHGRQESARGVARRRYSNYNSSSESEYSFSDSE